MDRFWVVLMRGNNVTMNASLYVVTSFWTEICNFIIKFWCLKLQLILVEMGNPSWVLIENDNGA
jgi:hypothetical protein